MPASAWTPFDGTPVDPLLASATLEQAAADPVFSAKPSDLSATFALSGRRQTHAFSHALCHAHRLARWRIGATLSFTPRPGASHRAIADAYLHALNESAGIAIRAQLLLSPADLGHDRGLLHEVMTRAGTVGVAVLFDHPALEHADENLKCLMDLQETHHARLGLSLLASRARSLDDARQAVAWGLRVRLEHDWPAFDRAGMQPATLRVSRQEVARRFIDLARLLGSGMARGRSMKVSVITHEPALADQALALLLAGGVCCAVELRQDQPKQGALYVARQRGVAVRGHVGWGEAARESDERARNPRHRLWSTLQGGLDTLLPAI